MKRHILDRPSKRNHGPRKRAYFHLNRENVLNRMFGKLFRKPHGHSGSRRLRMYLQFERRI